MKLLNLLTVSIALFLCGCSDVYDFPTQENQNVCVSRHIDQNEAAEIANKVLKFSPKTRNVAAEVPTFAYVMNESKTRSCGISDTLAYVINYPNDGGFVIVSTDRSVYPVLGFSDKGRFTFDNDICTYKLFCIEERC